jgi:hypothetical protein
VKVYAVWFDMYPGDERSKWPEKVLDDARVVHFWDEGKVVGRWLADQADLPAKDGVSWDMFLLYGPDAQWETDELPAPRITWGRPIFRARRRLRRHMRPLLTD